jgi:hypothetical protein
MYLVYLLPLFLIVLVALAIFAGPVIAVLFFVAFLVGLGAYKFFGPGTEPEHVPTGEAAATGTPGRSRREEAEGGVWGERWPERERGGEPTS